MFRFLVRDENLQVVKVALAIVTPWPVELLVEVRVSLALLCHRRDREGVVRVRVVMRWSSSGGREGRAFPSW
jgi:hypothetical protein